jgi:phosphoserine phosphatase
VTRGLVPPPPWPLITVDIDGTLTRVHGWRVIADALGRRPQFERTNRRFFAKEESEDDHLAEMLDIARGRTLTEVEIALASTPRISGIAEGVDVLHRGGGRVALLTHNPPYVCQWYSRTFGFDDFEGTSGQDVVDGIIQAPRGIRADKTAGLRTLVRRARVTMSAVVHIGDGWADATLFPLVGRGVALNSSLPEVEGAADLVLHVTDFREVVSALHGLGPRP